jgi:hypothetical protein
MRNLAVVIALTAGVASGQFQVASVKAVDLSKLSDLIQMNLGTVRHEEVTFENAKLNDCIRFAYGMASDAQIEAPDWVKSKRFLYTIDAKGPRGASRDELQTMMRKLLANRFALKVHRGAKEMSYYFLNLSCFAHLFANYATQRLLQRLAGSAEIGRIAPAKSTPFFRTFTLAFAQSHSKARLTNTICTFVHIVFNVSAGSSESSPWRCVAACRWR